MFQWAGATGPMLHGCGREGRKRAGKAGEHYRTQHELSLVHGQLRD